MTNLPQRSDACKGPKCGPTLRSPSKEGIGRSRNPSRGSQGSQGSQEGRVPMGQVELQEARATDGYADDLLEDGNRMHALDDSFFGSRELRHPQDSSSSRSSDFPSWPREPPCVFDHYSIMYVHACFGPVFLDLPFVESRRYTRNFLHRRSEPIAEMDTKGIHELFGWSIGILNPINQQQKRLLISDLLHESHGRWNRPTRSQAYALKALSKSRRMNPVSHGAPTVARVSHGMCSPQACPLSACNRCTSCRGW